MKHLIKPVMLAAMALSSSVALTPVTSAVAASPLMMAEVSYSHGKKYFPSQHVMQDVNETLAKALASGKRAALIIGANWCHDSRALAERFDDPAMTGIMKDNYELLYIDVGGLSEAREVMHRFGQAIYYHTPSVLIIDPKTEKVVNADNNNLWRDAEKVGLENSITYFKEMANRDVASLPDAPTGELKKLMDQIADFEKEQAKQISAGYEIVGKMVLMEPADRPKNMMDYWMEIRKLRFAVADDVLALKQEARQRIANGEQNVQLNFPTYAPYSWDEKGEE